MPKLVPITPSKMIKILERLGFKEVRVKGSHHSGEVLGVGILKMILRDIDLPLSEYEKLRLGK